MDPAIPSTSSSPQLLGILNTPPKTHRPSPYMRQNSNSSVQSSQTNQTHTSGAKVVQIPSNTPVKQNVVFPSVAMSPMVPAPSDLRPVPVLQNVVGTANLSCQLDLLTITSRTRNTEYNPSRFSGVVMRLREPRTTALLFQSGKMVVTGARSEADCNLSSRKIARIVQKLGYKIEFTGFRVTNMVATCDLKFPIRVESLNMMHGQFSSYEPELFPGLIYRMINPRVVILVFVNGKLCFTGAKNLEELNSAMDNIYPILKSFKKQ